MNHAHFILLYSFFYTIFMVVVLFIIFLYRNNLLEPIKVVTSLLLSSCLLIFVLFVYVPAGVNKDLLYHSMGFTHIMFYTSELLVWISTHQTFIYYFNYLGLVLNFCAIYFMFQAWKENKKK